MRLSKRPLKHTITGEEKGGTIKSQLQANPHIVEADKVHITNVIFNLLDNANKYSPLHLKSKLQLKILTAAY